MLLGVHRKSLIRTSTSYALAAPPRHYCCKVNLAWLCRSFAQPQQPALLTSRFYHSTVTCRIAQSQRSDFDQKLSRCKTSLTLPKATHRLETLTENDIGKELVLHGYLGSRVDLSKKISFVPLLSPNLTNSIQIISVCPSSVDAKDSVLHHHHYALRNIPSHSPVAVRGCIQPKQKAKKSPEAQVLGRHENIELNLTELHALNEFPNTVTFEEDTVIPAEQRHLQLRRNRNLRHALRFRADVANCCRRYFEQSSHHFVEIDTPLLFKSTPEGAREFLVPTRRKGLAYALPQSPQQYKQILMASGFEGYFQFAKCFRDEDLRADRQPEFMQLDLEMAFAGSEEVMQCIEALVKRLWKDMLSVNLPTEAFPQLSYEEAMSKYGSDKPDLRLGPEIMRIDYMLPVDLVLKISPLTQPIVEAMKLTLSGEPNESRSFVSDFMSSTNAKPFLENPQGQPGIFIYDSRKPMTGLQPFGFEAAERMEDTLELEEGDIVVIQAREDVPFSGGSTMIGNMRSALHHAAVQKGLIQKPEGWQFLWIRNFPMFTRTTDSEEVQGNGLSSTHHPFVAPATPEDIDLLATAPLEARADHYDLVLNGVELGGGSRRIHSGELQEYVLRNVLQLTEERLEDFSHLLQVLNSGCPPHAGIALGFDRLCAVMLGRESIRDVMAFPKTGRGEDALVKSPSRIPQQVLDTYHLKYQ